ncbi:hypothetical protein IW262DRAFT_1301975 [Armillaria fumosa]|nr:hypothetical protein IW262DRAFT_1301975 [Armillaria fumosa]
MSRNALERFKQFVIVLNGAFELDDQPDGRKWGNTRELFQRLQMGMTQTSAAQPYNNTGQAHPGNWPPLEHYTLVYAVSNLAQGWYNVQHRAHAELRKEHVTSGTRSQGGDGHRRVRMDGWGWATIRREG